MNQNEILLAYLEFWEDTELYMSSDKVINFGLPKSGDFVPDVRSGRDSVLM